MWSWHRICAVISCITIYIEMRAYHDTQYVCLQSLKWPRKVTEKITQWWHFHLGKRVSSVASFRLDIYVSFFTIQAQIWFPTQISDLDERANEVLEGGKDLKTDHPVSSCHSITIWVAIVVLSLFTWRALTIKSIWNERNCL